MATLKATSQHNIKTAADSINTGKITMKELASIIALVTSAFLMAVVAETFGAYLTAVFGIAAYKSIKWSELYFMNLCRE